MTNDEKAKAYDEAIKKAKEIKEKIMYSHLSTESCKAVSEYIDTIIPELRESEDERIRAVILKLVLGMRNEIFTTADKLVTKPKVLAWLEKQKENPKSADSIPSDCVSDAKCEDRSLKHSDSDGTDIRDTPAYWKGWDDAMKQKEQKPAEWSEEDEKMLTDISWAIRHCAYDDKKKERVMKWFNDDYRKSLRSSWKPSEEQMEALEECGECKRCIKELYEQLKKLM